MATSEFPTNAPLFIVTSLTHYVYRGRITTEAAEILEQTKLLVSLAIESKCFIFSRYTECKKKGREFLEIIGKSKEDIYKCVSLITANMPFISIRKIFFMKSTPINPFMELIGDINNNVFISTIESTEKIYLHLHTSCKHLKLLHFNLNNKCDIEKLSPVVNPELGTVCMAPGQYGWYRVVITFLFEDNFYCEVKYLDYGGHKIMPLGYLKKIPDTFLELPYQAIECKLANIIPKKEKKAIAFLWKLAYKKLVKAQIFRIDENGAPEVYLFVTYNDRVVFINEELIRQKYAYSKPN